MKKSIFVLSLLLLTISSLSHLRAATTKFWQLDQPEELMEGKFKGTGLTSDGMVKPTMNARRDTLPVNLIWEVASNDYGVLAGTSRPAALYWLEENGSVEKIIKRDGVGFTAVTASEGKLFAGFTPGGEVYAGRQGDEIEEIVSLDASFVLTLAADGEGGVYAGTGDPGKIYQISVDGTAELVARLEDHSVMSLTLMGDHIYAGTDQGSLYRQHLNSEEKSPTPLYNFPEREIRSLDSDGERLYLGVNMFESGTGQLASLSAPAGLPDQIPQELLQQQEMEAPPEFEELPLDPEEVEIIPPGELPEEGLEIPDVFPEEEELAPEEIESPEASPEEEPNEAQAIEFDIRRALERDGDEAAEKMFGDRVGTILVEFKPPDEMTLLFESREMTTFDLLSTEDGIYLATGGEGKVYNVKDPGEKELYFSTEQSQVTSLVSDKQGELERLSTANSAVIFQRQPFEAEKPRYLSPVFDARLLSRWGQFKTYHRGAVEYRTRSGLTDKPDNNWSKWSDWQAEIPFEIESPAARFVQFEARFNRPDDLLRRVEIARRASNQPPQIEKFAVSPDPRREIIFDDARSRGDLRPGGGDALARLIRAGRQDSEERMRVLEWEAVDLDNDQLSYYLYYRPMGAKNWISMADSKELAEESEYVWDPRQFADGRYEFKLLVTDELSNPPDETKSTSRVIGPVVVDNSPPVISNFSQEGAQISFEASDPTSRIVTAYYRCDGGSWRRLRTVDGLLDSRDEEFKFTLQEPEQESEVIELLIVDSSGNRRLRKYFLD